MGKRPSSIKGSGSPSWSGESRLDADISCSSPPRVTCMLLTTALSISVVGISSPSLLRVEGLLVGAASTFPSRFLLSAI